MKNLLQRLDKKAAQWIDAMDNELKEPVTQIVTGEVFVDGTNQVTNQPRPTQKQVTGTQPDNQNRTISPLAPNASCV